jgi:hypothetical protein
MDVSGSPTVDINSKRLASVASSINAKLVIYQLLQQQQQQQWCQPTHFINAMFSSRMLFRS